MSQYDLSKLNHQEFEELSRDVLNHKLQIDLQNFKAGKDGGIDLKLSSPTNQNVIIVQCKHYIKSDVAALLKALEDEKDKVIKLNPERYIVSTSLPLSDYNKQSIKAIFDSYILNTNDILGQEDITKYLNDNADIVRKHFKLWLTSADILQTIINNAAHGRSQFIKEKIEKNISLFVKNNAYTKATEILEENKFILISGLPGVGKTILSYLLTFELLAKDFKLIYVDQDIREAEDLYGNDEQKQIFLLDDFLGANYNEIVNPKSSHSSIREFINRIMSSHNKFCILTTRTNILNKSKLNSEKLRNSNIDVGKLELELKDYDVEHKGKILYSHLTRNNLPLHLIEDVFKEQNYWKIIKHRNYNPRLVEFITSQGFYKLIPDSDKYLANVFSTLENPQTVWAHAFENQIEKEDQYLIYVLFTFMYSANEKELELAYVSRQQYEVKFHGYQASNNSFQNSIKRLLDGFITANRKDELVVFQFVNPSVNDFLLNYFFNSKEERLKLVNSAVTFRQIERIVSMYAHFKSDKRGVLIDEWLHLLKCINEKVNAINFENNVPTPKNMSCKNILICNLMFNLTYWSFGSDNINKAIDSYTLELVKSIDFEIVMEWDFEAVIEFFKKVSTFDQTYDTIKSTFHETMKTLIMLPNSVDQIQDIKTVFEYFDLDLNKFINSHNDSRDISRNFQSVISENVKELISDEKNNVYNEDDIDTLRNKAERHYSSLSEELEMDFEYNEDYFFDNLDVYELISINLEQMNSTTFSVNDERPMSNEDQQKEVIDKLFSKIDV